MEGEKGERPCSRRGFAGLGWGFGWLVEIAVDSGVILILGVAGGWDGMRGRNGGIGEGQSRITQTTLLINYYS